MDLTTDLGDKVAEIEGLVDKRLKIGSLRFTYTQLVGAFALLSSIVGALYAGFTMFQRLESLATLDLDAVASQMAKTSADVLRVEEVASEIKVELKEDLARLRTAQYNLENRIDSKLQSIDVRITTMDNKLDKFDIQLDDTEEKLMKRIQQSLDNPLSN
jgi:Ser-tRNA(Ala) deacylase AlaX